MNDFILALGISAGGTFLMQQLDASQAMASQKASCATQGDTWTASGSNTGQCYNSANQPVNTTYNQWGIVPDLGLPLLAAVIITRSGGGIAGALIGAAATFLIGVGSIH